LTTSLCGELGAAERVVAFWDCPDETCAGAVLRISKPHRVPPKNGGQNKAEITNTKTGNLNMGVSIEESDKGRRSERPN
jgi:hypothetical protein